MDFGETHLWCDRPQGAIERKDVEANRKKQPKRAGDVRAALPEIASLLSEDGRMGENAESDRQPSKRSEMTIARMQQIRAAEMAGTPLDLAPEERAEYAAGNELVRTALEDLRPALGGGSAVLPVISALNRGPSNKFLADMETTQRRNQKMMDDFGKKMAEDHRSKAAAQAAEAEAERIRDEQMALQTKALSTLASQSLGQSKFNWWVLVIGLLTLIATVAGTVVGIVALARPGG